MKSTLFNVFVFCLLIYISYCYKTKHNLGKLDHDKDSLIETFDGDWDKSSVAEVDIDNVFLELSDQNLDKLEVSKGKTSGKGKDKGKSGGKGETCTNCVPVPPQYQ